MTCQIQIGNHNGKSSWNSHQDHVDIICDVITSCSPTVTLSPMIVGKTFPLKLDFATWTRELSCIFVPEPTLMLLTSPLNKKSKLEENKHLMKCTHVYTHKNKKIYEQTYYIWIVSQDNINHSNKFKTKNETKKVTFDWVVQH